MEIRLKRFLSLALAIMMVFSMMPQITIGAKAATPDTLYLKPNSNWTQAGARFAAYFFGNGDTWVSMTDSNGDDIYEVTVPGGYPQVIFVRMNPSTTANNWDNKWNQTGDLTIPTDGKNQFTVASGSWDGATTSWGTYTPPAAPVEHTWTVAGDSPAVFGTAWDTANTANDMTKQSDGSYVKVYSNVAKGTYMFKVARDHDWDVAYPASDYSLTVEPTLATVTITLSGTTVTAKVDCAHGEADLTLDEKQPEGCTEDGYKKVTCKCGHVVENTTLPAPGHSYEYDCSTTCKDCGEGTREVFHNFGDNAEHCTYGCGTENPDYEEPASTPSGTLDTMYVQLAHTDKNDSEKNRVYGEIRGLNASESVAIKLYSGETLLATTTLLNKDYFTIPSLGVNIVISGSASSSWETKWEDGMPRADLVPDNAVLIVDNTTMNTATVTLNAIDNLGDPVVWEDVLGVNPAPANYVAQVGETKYESLAEALAATKDNDTVTILTSTSETIGVPAGNNVTITAVEGVKLSGGVGGSYYNKSVTLDGLTFVGGKGIAMTAGVQGLTYTVKNCTFEGVQATAWKQGVISLNGNATVVIENNTITDVKNVTEGDGRVETEGQQSIGVYISGATDVTVSGNTVSGVDGTGINVACSGTMTITDNTISDWGTGATAKNEGRAIRTAGGTEVTITGNVMSDNGTAQESYVKATGTTNLDVSQNYWNGANPISGNYFESDVTGDPSLTLKSYYTDAEKQNLVEFSASVAKVGNTEYPSIDEAVANWTNNTTLTLLADVTLSDVITIKTGEARVLNLGTYTMTAAEGKNAIEIMAVLSDNNEKSTITINADATNPGGINAGNKSIVYYDYSKGTTTGNDRPIIKITGGVFTGSTSSFGTAGIYAKGAAARQCATINISGGTFNCSILGTSKSKMLISGGTFNYSVGSQGDSTCYRLISGGTFKSFGFMTADAANKFGVGSALSNYNVGLYVDDNGYLVVGGPVITEPGETFAASSTNYSGWSSYLKYSSAAANELYYTSVEQALADNTSTTSKVSIYVDTLDLTSTSYKGTLLIEDGLTVTFAEGTTPAWTVKPVEEGKVVVYTESVADGTVTRVYRVMNQPVAKVGDEYFETLKEAVEAANAIEGGATVELLTNVTLGEKLEISGNVTISGEYTITRDAAYTGNLFTVNAGATLTLDGVTVDGANKFVLDQAKLAELDAGTLKFNDNKLDTYPVVVDANAPVAEDYMFRVYGSVKLINATVQNHSGLRFNATQRRTGVDVFYFDEGSSLIMEGSTIKDNASNDAGAIFSVEKENVSITLNNSTITNNLGVTLGALVAVKTSGSSFTMTNSSIANNYCMGGVAVVYVTNGATMTMTDSKIVNTKGTTQYAVDVRNDAVFTMNGESEISGNFWGPRIGSNKGGTINLNGGVITDNGDYGLTLFTGTAHIGEDFVMDGNVYIEGGATLDNKGTIEGFVWLYKGDYAFSGGTYKGEFIVEECSLSITGGTYMGSFDVYEGASLSITGGTFGQDPSAYVAEGYVAVENGNDTWTVREANYVAQIGETKYESLADAIKNAKANDTIVLLTGITEDVTVNKSVTIDGANNTYTGNISVSGTSSAVTVKNVNFVNGTGYAITTNSIKSITVENCTVANYGFGFLYANKSTPTVVVKDVDVSDVNYGFHWVYGTNATLENVKMTNAAYGIMVQNYAAKKLTVTNCEISGANPIYIWERENKTGVQTFNFVGENTLTDTDADTAISTYAKLVLTDKDATLAAPEGLNVTTPVAGHKVTYKDGVYSVKPVVTVTFDDITMVEGNEMPELTYTTNFTEVAEDGMMLVVEDPEVTVSGAGEYEITANAYIFMSDDYIVEVIPGTLTVQKAVAEMNGVYYATIQAAINAAKDNDTVVLLENITLTDDDIVMVGNYKVMVNVEGKAITLDMNRKTIDVNYAGGQYLYAAVLVADGASLTVTGNGGIDIPENGENVAYMFWKRGTTGSLVVEDGTYHMNDSADSMVYTNGSESVTIEGGTWTLDTYGTRGNREPWIFNVAGQNVPAITINGGTYNGDVSNQYWIFEVQLGDGKAMQDNGNGTWTVVDAVATATYKLWVYPDYNWREYTGGYATVEEAIAAAGAAVESYAGTDIDGESTTVTLLKDMEVTGNLIVNEGVNLDDNDKQIVLVNETATLTAEEGLNVTTSVADHKVVYENGVYSVKEMSYGKVAMIGENYYETLSEAIAAAKSGETIVMIDDTEEVSVVLLAGVTLDLNGHDVTVTSYVAAFTGNHIIDSVGGGLLKIESNILLHENNKALPIWDDANGGYAFAGKPVFDEMTTEGNNSMEYTFLPRLDVSEYELIAKGAEISGVTMKVRAIWTASNGMPAEASFVYIDDLMRDFYNAYNPETGKFGQAFTLTLTGTDAINDLDFQVYFESDTGVILSCN